MTDVYNYFNLLANVIDLETLTEIPGAWGMTHWSANGDASVMYNGATTETISLKYNKDKADSWQVVRTIKKDSDPENNTILFSSWRLIEALPHLRVQVDDLLRRYRRPLQRDENSSTGYECKEDPILRKVELSVLLRDQAEKAYNEGKKPFSHVRSITPGSLNDI